MLLQQQAEARAAAFWDEDEAADLCEGNPRPIAQGIVGAIECVADVLTRGDEKQYFPQGYPAYLKTTHWRGRREHMLKRAGGYCMLCHRKHAWLEVHHLTYRNLGHEPESDLLVLCRECHQKEHTNAEPGDAR